MKIARKFTRGLINLFRNTIFISYAYIKHCCENVLYVWWTMLNNNCFMLYIDH